MTAPHAPPSVAEGPWLDPRPRPRHVLPFLRDELLGPLLVCAVLGLQAAIGLQGFDVLADAPVLLYTAPLLGAAMFFASRLVRCAPRLRSLLVARRQRRALGAVLDQLARAEDGALHGAGGVGFDLDHVLLTRSGVFAISVELLPLPAGCSASALFDGEFLLIDGAIPVRAPIARARVVARWLETLLADRAGWQVPVTPVLVLPGWEIQAPRSTRREACVATPAELLAFVAGLPQAFDRDELPRLRHLLAGLLRDVRQRAGHLRRVGSVAG